MLIVAIDTRFSGVQDVLLDAQRRAFVQAVMEQLEFLLGSAQMGLPCFVDAVLVAARNGRPEAVSKRLLNPSSLRALLDQPITMESGGDAPDSWIFARDAILAAGRLTSSNRRSVERHRLLITAPFQHDSDQRAVEKLLVQALEEVLRFGIMHTTCCFVDLQSTEGHVQPCFELAHPSLQADIVPNCEALLLSAIRQWALGCIGSVSMVLTLPPACGVKASVRMQVLPQLLFPVGSSSTIPPPSGHLAKDKTRPPRAPPVTISLEQWREHALPSNLQAPKVLHAVPASSLDLAMLSGAAFVVRPAEVADDLRSWRLNKSLFNSLCEALHNSEFALLLQGQASQQAVEAVVKEYWLLLPPKAASTQELLLLKAASREQALVAAAAATELHTADPEEQAMVDNFMRESIASIATLACYNPLDFRAVEPSSSSHHHHADVRRVRSSDRHAAESTGLQFRSV